MARLTINKINEEFRQRDLKIELVRGNGYFYFVGADVDAGRFSSSVYVYHLNSLTHDEWVKAGLEVAR